MLGHTADNRGWITDLVEGPIDCATQIFTTRGSIRGNHVHKLTHQWTYVAIGLLKVKTKDPDGTIRETVYPPGSLAYEPPGTEHAWQALEDTYCLVLSRGPRSGEGYESDTYRDGIHLL